MKPHFITVLVLISLLCNCGTKADMNTGVQDNMDQNDQIDTFFSGGGNEPGWSMILMKNGDGEFLYDLKLDYGERRLSGFAQEINTLSISHRSFILEANPKGLRLNINEELCVDDGDFEFTHTILLSDSKFRFMGCGRFAEVIGTE